MMERDERRAANLAIWRGLETTDKAATKPFTRAGGFRGHSIDPVYRMWRMTEMFGPVGEGWGWEQLDWTVQANMVFICVRVWYKHDPADNPSWTGPQWGGTELVYRNRDGTERPNDEAFKMSLTDALGKCLLSLGLAADVHRGVFDGDKYRPWDTGEDQPAARQQAAHRPSGPSPEEVDKEECQRLATRIRKAITNAPSLHVLHTELRAHGLDLDTGEIKPGGDWERISKASPTAIGFLYKEAEGKARALHGRELDDEVPF